MARNVNGFLGTYPTIAAVTAAFPPSEHVGCSANIGTATPYQKAWCDGISWAGLTASQVEGLSWAVQGVFGYESDKAALGRAKQREFYEALAFPAVYYDPSLGADTGNGSRTSPYRDLTAARATGGLRHLLKAGTTIAVSAGATSVWLSTTTSGTAAAPVIIGRYGDGANPLINCTGAQRGIRFGTNVKYWRVRDIEIYGNSAGTDRYGISQNSVDATADQDTTYNHVLERVTVRDITGDASTDCNGIKLYGADNELINCTVYNIGTDAMWIHGNRTLIQSCIIWNVATDGRIAGDCIQFGAASNNSIVRGCDLDHRSTDGKQCIYFEQTVSVSDSVLVEGNICRGWEGATTNSASPLLCGATNSIVRYNYVTGGIQGILLGEGTLGYGNIVLAPVGRGLELQTGAKAFHNTMVQTGAQTGQTLSVGIRTPSGAVNTEARNNVIVGFANSILVGHATTTAVESHNAFYTTGGTPAHYRVNGTITAPTDALIGSSAADLGLDAAYRPTSLTAAVYTTLYQTPSTVVQPVDKDQRFGAMPRGAYLYV